MTRDTLAFFILIALAVLALVIIERGVTPPTPMDQRIVIDAVATTQPALCYPLPTPIDRPKRGVAARLEDA